ncbi:MAG TPA: hypothetical protein VIT20_08595 [Propionibacteriaceae bacterium]
MDNLPALMGGQVLPHERRAKVLRPAVKAVAGHSGALLVLAMVLFVLGGPAAWVAGAGAALLAALVVFGVVNVTTDQKLLQLHPDLGARQTLWERAGATPHQLRLLNEAHRVDRLNPPVGYGDRRTVINPLGDAYAIFTSPAWRDPWLADRQLQIDPIIEAAEIIAFVHQVTGLLREVAEQIRVAVPGSPAQRTYLGFERSLLGSLDDGLRRARALTAYRSEVSRLEVLLTEQLALPQAEAFADRVMDVLSESARQELATRQIEDGRDQLQMLEAGLREITELMNRQAQNR